MNSSVGCCNGNVGKTFVSMQRQNRIGKVGMLKMAQEMILDHCISAALSKRIEHIVNEIELIKCNLILSIAFKREFLNCIV